MTFVTTKSFSQFNGKTAQKPQLERQKMSPFEISIDNSRFNGCCADLPFSGLGPTGFLLGRGGQKAVQYGYSESAGVLNHGARRIGWGYRGTDNSNVLRVVVDKCVFRRS
jgi:hypothetical protein